MSVSVQTKKTRSTTICTRYFSSSFLKVNHESSKENQEKINRIWKMDSYCYRSRKFNIMWIFFDMFWKYFVDLNQNTKNAILVPIYSTFKQSKLSGISRLCGSIPVYIQIQRQRCSFSKGNSFLGDEIFFNFVCPFVTLYLSL